MRNLRGEKVYPGAFRRVVLRQENLLARGLLPDADWLELRQLRGNDFYAVEQLRLRDREWLEPWEANSPPGYGRSITMTEYLARAAKSARSGEGLYFGVLTQGLLSGQVSLSQVTRGATMSGSVGYWINSRFAGRGVMPLAVAMVIDWALTEYGLHRVEINVRPENNPSLRLVEKLGLRFEGVRESYIYIDGQWADHRSFAITKEEWAPGVLIQKLQK